MAKFNKQLLVEGNDDLHVICCLCQKFGIDENFEVIDCKGINKLFVQIPVRLKQSGFETLGIIIDADTNIQSRYQNLKQIFLALGITLPDELPNNGLIFQKDNLRIGIWIMPNNNLNGILEDFVSFLIPKADKLLSVVNQNLLVIEQKKLNNYRTIDKGKALIHSWLALQEDPGTPMGLAITKKYLTGDSNECQELISWLIATFT